MGSVATYFNVNISSPNTPGLRDLQAPETLDALLKRAQNARGAPPKSRRFSSSSRRTLPMPTCPR